tara:strand:- start:133 stop:243 length:111 start_codon:yes stop_codon:yes gene_type:complete
MVVLRLILILINIEDLEFVSQDKELKHVVITTSVQV